MSTTFTPDYSKATLSGEELAKQLSAASAQATAAAKAAAEKAAAATAGTWKWKLIGGVIGTVVVIVLLIVIYDFTLARWFNLPSAFVPKPAAPSGPPPASNILYIARGTYGGVDVTSYIQGMIQNETTLPSFTVSYAALGLATDPEPTKLKTLEVTWYVGQSGEQTTTAPQGTPFPQLPTSGAQTQATGPAATTQAAEPPFFSKLWNSFTGGSSGDLAPSFHDATTSAVVSGSSAPLSAEREGGYGMQWWMYVKDWNYGYGKDKAILVRPDATNSAVMNPNITLHPTDNSMKISVSIFPNTEGGAAASQPAPAGHSGSSDDVFVCEVPNIPLQTWFSVGVTVFGRNLDVYIDGKLVKSCFLNGVPKPAVGDIQLTPAGGFSGRMCNFYHYPRMLTPQDALSFWESGTPCKNKTAAGGSSPTGYSVKFGVYDALGKEVTEYAF